MRPRLLRAGGDGRARRAPAVILALLAAGCTQRAADAPSEPDALLQVDPSALVESVDGWHAQRVYSSAPLRIAPGSRIIRVRRRVEVAVGPASQLTGDPSRVRGTSEQFSDEYCAFTFAARAGSTYRTATVTQSDADAPWSATLDGPDVSMSCVGRPDAVPTAMVGQTRYLCCNMSFDNGETSDANYRYTARKSAQLGAGTRVVVTEVSRDAVAFKAEPDGKIYRVRFRFGRFKSDPETYFNEILREQDPTPVLRGLSVDDVAAARLVPGMTREQTLVLRGYPPLHRTPDRSAATWLYYNEAGLGTYVTFADGVIATVREAPAP